MGEYLAMRIMQGHLNYKQVVSKFLQFKDEIDNILIDKGMEHLISV